MDGALGAGSLRPGLPARHGRSDSQTTACTGPWKEPAGGSVAGFPVTLIWGTWASAVDECDECDECDELPDLSRRRATPRFMVYGERRSGWRHHNERQVYVVSSGSQRSTLVDTQHKTRRWQMKT